MSEIITRPEDVRIFLLEDEQEYLDEAIKYLSWQGFGVVASAMNGLAAIDYIDSNAFTSHKGPNVAILDYNLRERLTGADVARAILAVCPSFPIISGSASRSAFFSAGLPQVKVPETCSMIEISELIIDLIDRKALQMYPNQKK